eukprot:2691682-Lingulodinium_polyedra.AAC.1
MGGAWETATAPQEELQRKHGHPLPHGSLTEARPTARHRPGPCCRHCGQNCARRKRAVAITRLG